MTERDLELELVLGDTVNRAEGDGTSKAAVLAGAVKTSAAIAAFLVGDAGLRLVDVPRFKLVSFCISSSPSTALNM